MRFRGTVLAALVFAGCAVELEGEPEGPRASSTEDHNETPDPEDTSLENAQSDITNLGTPTCNRVTAFNDARVPYYNGNPKTVNCNMVRTCDSDAVWQLQRSMNRCYGESLMEDGEFGSNTEAALIRTQKAAGTTADGEYGPNTRRAMLHEPLNGGPCRRVP